MADVWKVDQVQPAIGRLNSDSRNQILKEFLRLSCTGIPAFGRFRDFYNLARLCLQSRPKSD
jgi:hypothetical protein